jgi:hypothetical protein
MRILGLPSPAADRQRYRSQIALAFTMPISFPIAQAMQARDSKD